tara:strand:+ start:417 stop:971 length:555 start_codon:yes stop_codon:yes gene_type:complete
MSTIKVENLTGLTSGANANKIIIPAGQTLHAPGHVVQMVNTSWNTKTTITANSYTTISGASLAITPKSSTSKILVLANMPTSVYDPNTGYAHAAFNIFRGSTLISGTVPTDGTGAYEIGSYGGGGAVEFNHRYTNNIVDTPSTTSATTYSIKAAVYGGAGGTIFVNHGNAAQGTSSIILMEIAA